LFKRHLKNLNILLAVLAAVLAAFFLYQATSWLSPQALEKTPTAVEKKPRQPETTNALLSPKETAPSRPNPFAPPSPLAGKRRTSAESIMTVYGIVIESEEAFALVSLGGPGGEVKRVYKGESIGPYLLSDILPNKVIVERERDGRSFEIKWKRPRESILDGQAADSNQVSP
jgi:hypothetical protein